MPGPTATKLDVQDAAQADGQPAGVLGEPAVPRRSRCGGARVLAGMVAQRLSGDLLFLDGTAR
jgi:hypothetical protein